MKKQAAFSPWKILLVQIVNRNLGDAVIADNAEYLLRKALPKEQQKTAKIFRYNIGSAEPLSVQFADAVVFAGGGLIKFKQEQFYEPVIQVLEEAEKHHVPVFFNSVGVEGYDPEDERCINLQRALNLPCVKGFSCRDDCSTLQDTYLSGKAIPVDSVPDPAVWCPETYQNRLEKPDRKCIGLGITRPELFLEYGTGSLDADFQLQFWKEVTTLLEEKGYTWKLFTNGLTADEQFAEQVLSFIGHGEKVTRPANGATLVNTINGFRGIIAGRMHSNIIAFSLGVPSVGFVWNEKIRFWGQKIGKPERFLAPSSLTAEEMVFALEAAISEGAGKLKETEKQALVDSLSRFFREKVSARNVTLNVDFDYRNHLISTALGGKDLINNNLNTPVGIKDSLKSGFRFLEVDVRLDANDKLVCVNGWNEDTYRRLGQPLPPEAEGDPEQQSELPPLSGEAFKEAKSYGLYPTSNLHDVLHNFRRKLLFAPHADAILILDIGIPEEEKKDVFFQQLHDAFHVNRGGPWMSSIHVWICIRTAKDYGLLRKQKLDFNVIYYLPKAIDSSEEEQDRVRRAIDYCEQKGIEYISVATDNWNESTAALCKESHLKPVVMSYSNVDDIARAFDLGAELVGSHQLTPNYFKDLTF